MELYELTAHELMDKLETGEITSEEITKTFGDEVFSLKADLDIGDGAITYSSSNENVATIDDEGNVTIVAPGETLLSVNVSETNNYEAIVKSVLLRVNSLDNSDEVLEGIPNTSKKISFNMIRNIFSIFLILLGITYIVRKKLIFEK